MTQEALKLALEFLEDNQHFIETYERPEYLVMYNDVIDKCKEALAQEQEPVAWMYQEYRDDDQFGWRDEILFTPPPNDPIYFRNITPVYTHPPQRTEQNFCSRCGKRVGGIDSIHTCTPPMEKNT